MEKQFADYFAAWDDFFEWVKKHENWKGVDRFGRDQIAKAQKRRVGEYRSPLTEVGIKSLLTKHAPTRYLFEEHVILIDKGPA